MKRHEKENGEEGTQPKYPGLGAALRIAVVLCYIMWGVAIIFFIIGIIGIVILPLLPFLAASFMLAFFAFSLLIQVRLVQLVRDIEVNTRQTQGTSNIS